MTERGNGTQKLLQELQEQGKLKLSLESLEHISGGVSNETSDNLFRALIVSFKKGGLSKEELAGFIKTSDSVFNVKGIKGVTVEDAMDCLDQNWDKL